MKNTKFNNMTGSEILEYYYNTTDPYTITWKYMGNKGILNASGLMNDPESLMIEREDGHGYKPNMTVKFEDIARWWCKQNKLPFNTYTKKLVIEAARNPTKNIDYFPNRSSTMVPPDEPICWLSYVLGIETIQMPMSANDNGLWCYEIIDLRLPTPENSGLNVKYKNWKRDAKERKYSFINGGGDLDTTWNPDAVTYWNMYMQTLLSVKDPLNIKKSENCKNMALVENLTKRQCEIDAFPHYQSFTNQNNPGVFINGKCYVTVENKSWNNLPCNHNTISDQYVKLPLMISDTSYPINTGSGSGSGGTPS